MSDVGMLASELARHLSVSPSTITNWATKAHQPLEFVVEQGRRRFRLDDYDRFAETHSRLRGVAKQVTDRSVTAASPIASDQSLMEVRERLEKLLEQINAVQDGSDQTKKSAAKLKRELTAALKLLPATPTADDPA